MSDKTFNFQKCSMYYLRGVLKIRFSDTFYTKDFNEALLI